MTTAAAAIRDLLVPLPGVPGFSHVSLARAEAAGLVAASRLPRTLKILAEGMLRRPADGPAPDLAWLATSPRRGVIEMHPSRLLLQDFTGIPVMTDLAALRDAAAARGLDPRLIDPVVPVDFCVDHALIAEFGGSPDARARNEAFELERNAERFRFLKWCARAFPNVRVLPPGSGIMHQLNLEYLSRVVRVVDVGATRVACPDTLLGTDSHTPMVNGLGVFGFGVGGLEAEAAMLGHGTLVSDPKVACLHLVGDLRPGVGANDLVLSICEHLRAADVVGTFIDVVGQVLPRLSVETRATIANMAPEYGATSVLFPIDERTLDYLRLTARSDEQITLVEAYAKAQGLWGAPEAPEPGVVYDRVITFDISTVEPCLAGPSRPDQRVALARVPSSFADLVTAEPRRTPALSDGDVVIAAITSCTSTSNPSAMIAAALLARNARARGLTTKPWVKTTFAPGSRVVSDYLAAAGLQPDLDALGFHVVGFGCTTCNGNSGSLAPDIAAAIRDGGVTAAAVLSGNRNFEGRIHALVRAGYLASPALVVAYAIAGSVRVDLTAEPIGVDSGGHPVSLADVWPDDDEIARYLRFVSRAQYDAAYSAGLDGHAAWRALEGPQGERFPWDVSSTFFAPSPIAPLRRADEVEPDLEGLLPLAIVGDAINTDHLSPNGEILPGSQAARWLDHRGVAPNDHGTYAARRGNHEIALRATFANAHVANEMVPGKRGPWTRLPNHAEPMPIVEAGLTLKARGVPSIVIAGRRYGSGSSRDWAAKGLAHLGVRAVVAESFERIHRANLAAVAVLPLTFPAGVTRKTLALDGSETYALRGLRDGIRVGGTVTLVITRASGASDAVALDVRLETPREAETFIAGGLLPVLLRDLDG